MVLITKTFERYPNLTPAQKDLLCLKRVRRHILAHPNSDNSDVHFALGWLMASLKGRRRTEARKET